MLKIMGKEIFTYTFTLKIFVDLNLCTHWQCLIEMLPMHTTSNFYEEIKKKIFVESYMKFDQTTFKVT